MGLCFKLPGWAWMDTGQWACRKALWQKLLSWQVDNLLWWWEPNNPLSHFFVCPQFLCWQELEEESWIFRGSGRVSTQNQSLFHRVISFCLEMISYKIFKWPICLTALTISSIRNPEFVRVTFSKLFVHASNLCQSSVAELQFFGGLVPGM